MPKEKQEPNDKKDKLKAYRKKYYLDNRAHIRERDNESARRNREKDPERYNGYIVQYKARKLSCVVRDTPLPAALDKTIPDTDPETDEMIGGSMNGGK